MPVNFQQALQQIREMGKQAPLQEEEMRKKREQANVLFVKYARELDTLVQLVERAAAENPGLRCAMPVEECLNETFTAPPLEPGYTLLAADGSQINPDRHGMVEFGAINVGAIDMRPGQGGAPQEIVRSRLLFNRELMTASGSPLTDDIVALMRDLAERQELVEMARRAPRPVVALTDGPLELFREPKGMPEFQDEMKKYQAVLEELANLDVATAGYVDRPRSDLLIRLLELVILEQTGQLKQAGLMHPLQWVQDSALFWTLLKPGQRSAVFKIHSGSSNSFKDRLALHFFYLNVGREGHPYFSRVEIPAWVAENKALLDLLHGCLLSQARHLGAKPYPYILHRAHEIAVVSFDEHRQIENMIVAELRRQGIEVGDRSNKQIAKDASANHTTRTR